MKYVITIVNHLVLLFLEKSNYVNASLSRFLKPRTLLCSHFWSIQQKVEFSTQDLVERLKNNKPVFRALQARLDSIPNGDLKDKWKNVIAQLGSGVHPTPEDILSCKDLFVNEPYQLSHLTYNHAVSSRHLFGPNACSFLHKCYKFNLI